MLCNPHPHPHPHLSQSSASSLWTPGVRVRAADRSNSNWPAQNNNRKEENKYDRHLISVAQSPKGPHLTLQFPNRHAGLGERAACDPDSVLALLHEHRKAHRIPVRMQHDERKAGPPVQPSGHKKALTLQFPEWVRSDRP
ncbi:hypothetical protein EYF80_057473 [Liparis tanakae]|uniref:Uncharacterized protein n=1 Tax=Liparis tanakae TaxID=230148 RepID=A0A4Z2ETX7_9TELE|nr:hypothetical protein EYF80_057473 [Liparis tanakae]